MLEVANHTAVVGGDTTAHEVRQRARCNNYGVEGNNTYQIVYRGASDAAMDGAGPVQMGRLTAVNPDQSCPLITRSYKTIYLLQT